MKDYPKSKKLNEEASEAMLSKDRRKRNIRKQETNISSAIPPISLSVDVVYSSVLVNEWYHEESNIPSSRTHLDSEIGCGEHIVCRYGMKFVSSPVCLPTFIKKEVGFI